MQNWNQWQVPTGPVSAAMPQPPVGYPSTGSDPMATMQAYMQYYNQPAPSGYTAEQWAAAQQQNWAQWQQWQQQYQQWQSQYGDKYQETMKQYSAANLVQPPPLPSVQQPPLPKDDTTKPPLPPDPTGQYNFTSMPPPNQNNLPLFPTKQVNSGQDIPQNPPLPPSNPPLPSEQKQTSSVSDKSSVDSESAKKMKLDEEKLIEVEKTFDAQFKQWEEQFNIWKQKNANHPDKEQYKQYEAKWTSWREKLLERREQMRRKREQQKQAAKVEAEKKKDLPGGDKILNILSNTENQGLINNLLGIGKTLGLTGKQDVAMTSATTSQPSTNNATTAGTLPNAVSQTSSMPAMQGPMMTAELNQQTWAAQQWAQYNTGFSGYQMPPPTMQPTQNMGIPPPNFAQQPPNFSQQPPNFSQQPSNLMQPPPNFSLPPPNFAGEQNMFNKPPPLIGSKLNPIVNKPISDIGGLEMNRGSDDRENFNDQMNEANKRMDINRFGPGNNRFGSGNDNFSSTSSRLDLSFGAQFRSDRFGKGNDGFDNKNNDRFGPGNNRFGPNNDRFATNDRFGNKNLNEPSSYNSELAPELRKLMEKRRAAMDTFKPRSTFLDPEKTLNVGSLRESFKKITGDSLFKSRNISGSEDAGSFGIRGLVGPRGLPFGPRGNNEFEFRGPPFGLRGPSDFDSSPRNFGPRGGPSNVGPRGPANFSLRGPNNFGVFGNPNPPMQQSDQDFATKKEGLLESETNMPVSQENNLKQSPMESPKIPEILEEYTAKNQEVAEQNITVVPPEEEKDKKTNDIVEIPHSQADNESVNNSWMNPEFSKNSNMTNEPSNQNLEDSSNKNDNLPFMGEDDPKPTDLNMEPPPDFPNLGPVITTPMDPPPVFMEGNFSSNEESLRDSDNRPFDGSFNPRGPPPFGMRGPNNNFGPRGNNQPFSPNEQMFGPRGMNSMSFRSFGPRGMDGPPPFGPRGNMLNQQFGPRGMNNQSFGPRGGIDNSFGPRNRMDEPRMDGPRMDEMRMDGPPPFRSNMDNSFGNRQPFGNRDSFQPEFNQSNEPPKKIPSLFDLKFDFKKPDITDQNFGNIPNKTNFSDKNFEPNIDQPFGKDMSAGPFNPGNSGIKQDQSRSWGPPPSRNKFDPQPNEPDFTADTMEDEINPQPPILPEKEINTSTNVPSNIENRSHMPDVHSQNENGSNYDPFEMFKNRDKERDIRKQPIVDFCAPKQFNYNHGVNLGVKNRSIHDHIPIKVIDYAHNPHRVQELMMTSECYDYGHGQLKPTVPDQVYPMRRDFRNWEENEQNLREYFERIKDWEFDNIQRENFRQRSYMPKRREEQVWREEMVYRENRPKRRKDTWDTEMDIKKSRYEKDSMNYSSYRENKKRNKEKPQETKKQGQSFNDDDFLEEISWDGDNDQCLKDVTEDTKNDDISNLENGQNGADTKKKMDISKISSSTMVDDLLSMPGRQNRPPKIVIILRGPPGSGKSFVAKLIKDKEVEQGGSAPRILSLDDYFLVEKEVETKDDNGKKITFKEMVYEYEEIMEPSYTASLAKAFKKNVTDGFFNFIILDSINEKISDYEELWNFAKSKGFKVYVCEMEMDIQICLKRNIHNRSEDEINRVIDYFEPTPSHHQILDVNSLLQEQEIEEVQMEDSQEEKQETKPVEEDQDSQDDLHNAAPVSKWEQMDAEDKLDRLDGLTKHKHEGKPQTMEDFLQVPDYYDMEDNSGKKRVRWADLEERKEQEKMRAVGFVVGHTNWNRMMDPTKGSSALTRTKYI